jgi:hypothetical protein
VARVILVVRVTRVVLVTAQVVAKEELRFLVAGFPKALEHREVLVGLIMQIAVMLVAVGARVVAVIPALHRLDLVLTFRAEPAETVAMQGPPEARAQEVAMAVTQLCFTTMVVEAEGVQVAELAAQTPPPMFFNPPEGEVREIVIPATHLAPEQAEGRVRRVIPGAELAGKEHPATATQIAAHLVH